MFTFDAILICKSLLAVHVCSSEFFFFFWLQANEKNDCLKRQNDFFKLRMFRHLKLEKKNAD